MTNLRRPKTSESSNMTDLRFGPNWRWMWFTTGAKPRRRTAIHDKFTVIGRLSHRSIMTNLRWLTAFPFGLFIQKRLLICRVVFVCFMQNEVQMHDKFTVVFCCMLGCCPKRWREKCHWSQPKYFLFKSVGHWKHRVERWQIYGGRVLVVALNSDRFTVSRFCMLAEWEICHRKARAGRIIIRLLFIFNGFIVNYDKFTARGLLRP